MSTARWDPRLHPRGPLGRFIPVGGRPSSQRPSSNPWAWDADDSEVGEEIFSDLSVIPGHEGWLGQLLHPGTAERLRVFQEANDAYFRSQRVGEERIEPHDHGHLPDWGAAESSQEGYTRADIEAAILAHYESGRALEDQEDLSKGGSMNNGVRRGTVPGTDIELVIKQSHEVDEADAEVLATEVGHAIGVRVPVVISDPDDRRRVAMEAIPGTIGVGTDVPKPPGWARAEVQSYREGAARMIYLDRLIGNPDRHDGNWMLTDDGRLYGIDHGLSFDASSGGMRDANRIAEIQDIVIRGGMGQESGNWFDYTDRVPSSEVLGWGDRLMATRPMFAARGRERWHDQMMTNWGQIVAQKQREES